jgi:hypothetical protein
MKSTAMDGRRRRIRLSPGRTLVGDVIRFALKAPLGAVETTFDLTELAQLRRHVRPRLSWNAIFMKAYGLMAADWPQLRQFMVPFPTPHLYQHDRNVCLISVTRRIGDEDILLFGRLESPESDSLIKLQRRIDSYRNEPVLSIRQFRHQLRFARVPWPIRSLGYWIMCNLWPSRRGLYLGTFGMSISGFDDVRFTTFHLGPCTTTLGVDVVSRGGHSRLLLTFDHRILDGKPVIDIIRQLERTLRGPICDEMRRLAAMSLPDSDKGSCDQAA